MTATAVLGRRVTTTVVVLLLALAAAAWSVVVRQAATMDGMPDGLASIGAAMPMGVGVPLFVGMWVAMMAAMMLPTALPMVLAHHLVVRQRQLPASTTVVFVVGYLVSWTVAGLVPAVFLTGWLEWATMLAPGTVALVAGAVLAVAGAYQFTGWKAACLRSCRTPMHFLLRHDFGTGRAGALRAGASHGLYCLGCCWALMSVLAVVGFMNLVWMVALSLVFLTEKTWRHGPVVARVAGTTLIVLGGIVAWHPAALPLIAGG